MRDERGVVGKHSVEMPGVARCKHGVCGQIGMGAKASAAEFCQANLRSQLPLSIERTVLTGQWRVVVALCWLLLNRSL